MSGTPAAAASVENQSRLENFSTTPGLIFPDQRMMAGTRKPPSKVVCLRRPERRHATIRPGKNFSVVVRGENDDGIVSLADIVQAPQQIADRVVELWHAGFLDIVVVLVVDC
jgi:hypothetical protein